VAGTAADEVAGAAGDGAAGDGVAGAAADEVFDCNENTFN